MTHSWYVEDQWEFSFDFIGISLSELFLGVYRCKLCVRGLLIRLLRRRDQFICRFFVSFCGCLYGMNHGWSYDNALVAI